MSDLARRRESSQNAGMHSIVCIWGYRLWHSLLMHFNLTPLAFGALQGGNPRRGAVDEHFAALAQVLA